MLLKGGPKLAAIVLALAMLMLAGAASARASYTLSSGSPQGVYYSIAQKIADAARPRGIDLKVLPSTGSQENLFRLSESRADLALAQSDIVFDAYNGIGHVDKKLPALRGVMSLYPEAVHILVRNSLYLRRIEEFRGKRISLGPSGSGTEANARAILEAAGITLEEVSPQHRTVDDTILSLRKGDVDIAFVTIGIPSQAVERVLADRVAYLFEPKPDLLQRLISTRPFFSVLNIPPHTYSNQDEEITTIGVTAQLVGRQSLDNKVVYDLVSAIFEHPGMISAYHGTLTVNSAQEVMTIPLFKGAARYYSEASLIGEANLRRAWLAGLLALVLLGLVLIVAHRGRLFSIFYRHKRVRVLVGFIFVWLAGSLCLYYAEHRFNENYSNFFVSLWSGMITIFSLSNKEPVTFQGRVVAIIMLALGYTSLGLLIGELASIYIKDHLMGAAGKMMNSHNHFVVLNWNDKERGIIEQLHGEDFREKRSIIVVAKDLKKDDFASQGIILHLAGDPLDEEVLRRARAHRAHSIIILAGDGHDSSDAATIMTIMAVRKLCAGEKMPQVPIIAEIIDPQKVALATYAGGEEGGMVEVVSAQKFGERLLTHAAANPGLTTLYERLLTFEKENSEIHSSALSKEHEKLTFDDLIRRALDLRVDGTSILPIAIMRGSLTAGGEKEGIFVNPTHAQIGNLRAKDTLFALCDNAAELKKLL
jgi:uncharacterized protein